MTARAGAERRGEGWSARVDVGVDAVRFADLGTAPVAQDRATPEAHRRFWQADIAKWRPIIQAAGQFAD